MFTFKKLNFFLACILFERITIFLSLNSIFLMYCHDWRVGLSFFLYPLYQQLESINRSDKIISWFQEIIMLQKCYIMTNSKWNLLSMKFHFNLKILQIRIKVFFQGEYPFLHFKMEFPQICWMPTQKEGEKRLLKHGFLLELDFPSVGQASSVIPDKKLACCSVAVDALASEITDH